MLVHQKPPAPVGLVRRHASDGGTSPNADLYRVSRSHRSKQEADDDRNEHSCHGDLPDSPDLKEAAFRRALLSYREG